MSNLYNKLREEADSGSGDGAAITSSDDIAYSPQMLGVIPFPGVSNWEDRYKKRKKKMREAIDVKVQQLLVEIKNEFKTVASSSKLTHNEYIKYFSYIKDFAPQNILINAISEDRSIDKALQLVGEDVGELELILTSLQNRSPLNKFESFADYDNLFGCRLQSLPVKTVTFIYEGYADQNYIERETIIIGDPDVVSALQQKGLNTIRTQVQGKWARIYPTQRYFDSNFYVTLKEIVNSDFEEVDTGGEDEQDTEEIS